MKRTFFLLSFLFTIVQSSFAQQPQPQINPDSIASIFDEIKTASKKHINLWNTDLYGPLLFVVPQTRELFANEADTAGILKPNGSIYSGQLPNNVNIANTALNWGGKRWAMLMLPLSKNKHDRINLLAHELFHGAQPALGFSMHHAENNHLDQKDGRIYLRLELEALQKALQATSKKEVRQHLTDALIFRKYRQQLYEGAGVSENLLELNEGVAEFTGLIVSDRTKVAATKSLLEGIQAFFNNPTFVRSFAYHTTPIYGYLLYGKDKNWNKNITDKTDLTAYFITAFGLKIPADLKKRVESIKSSYGGDTIIAAETTREENTKKLIAEYKSKFVEQPHFELKFIKMNVSFDPRNMVPIEGQGTVYPTIRVTDVWGILTAENGALMSANWDKLSLSNPTDITTDKVTGDGWVLELTAGYSVMKDETSGLYKLVKSTPAN